MVHIWEVEAGELGVQCQHQLHGEFRACLCYIGSVCLSVCLKTQAADKAAMRTKLSERKTWGHSYS